MYFQTNHAEFLTIKNCKNVKGLLKDKENVTTNAPMAVINLLGLSYIYI